MPVGFCACFHNSVAQVCGCGATFLAGLYVYAAKLNLFMLRCTFFNTNSLFILCKRLRIKCVINVRASKPSFWHFA